MIHDLHKYETSLAAFAVMFVGAKTKPNLLEDIWRVLTPEERQRATKGATGYAAHCRKNIRRPMDPVKFLRNPELWGEFAAVAG